METTMEAFQHFLSRFITLFLREDFELPGKAMFVLIIATLTVPLALFHFVQWLYSQSNRRKNQGILPPYVHSFLPYIGSTIEMGQDIQKFQLNYFLRFRKPIFSATINGNTCHFIHPTENFQLLFRTKEFDDRVIQMQFVTNALGMKDKVFASKIISDVHGIGKPFLEQYHTFLFTRDELNKTIHTAQVRLNQVTAKYTPYPSSLSSGWFKLDLFRFVTDAVYDASIAALISTHVANDECRRYHENFDSKIALFHSGLPCRFFPKALQSRERLVAKIMEPEFATGASKMIKARLQTYQELCIPPEEGARFILGILWAAVGNSIPAIFWLLYHLMRNKDAYNAVQSEVDHVVKQRKVDRSSGCDNEKGSYFTIEELDQMPVLNSAFTEALRLSHGAFSLRQVLSDFTLNVKDEDGKSQPYFLGKGSNVMMLMSIMHQDPTIFTNPQVFQYNRFLPESGSQSSVSFERNGKVLDPLRFFGGGSHMCPGRKFIVYEAKAFAASLLDQFEMTFSEETENDAVLGIDKTYQGLGVNKPDRDVQIVLRPRVTT